MIDKILTIDLEYDFESKEDKSLKVIVPKLLDYFSENNITATFFVIGEIAEKYPKLVKKISKSHEVASHGYDHSYINENSLDYQLRKSKLAIEKLGIKCKGFRAPYFMKIPALNFFFTSSQISVASFLVLILILSFLTLTRKAKEERRCSRVLGASFFCRIVMFFLTVASKIYIFFLIPTVSIKRNGWSR